MEKTGPGRPEFQPTDTMRSTVKAMAAYGVPQDDIGRVVGCSPPTLRKYFWTELETAATEANAKVAQTLFRTATEGKGKEAVTAAIFWLKCRAGWRDVSFEGGKKEELQRAAQTAGAGSDWGDDLKTTVGSPLN